LKQILKFESMSIRNKVQEFNVPRSATSGEWPGGLIW
jgi:hypothetical protein